MSVSPQNHPKSMMCMPTENNDSGESTSGGQSKLLKRACDCCRKRKVRCDGESPCGPCRKATIRCAYLQAPKKKGPKGLRSARVLHALRKIDQSASISPESPFSPALFHDGISQWSWSSTSSPSAVPIRFEELQPFPANLTRPPPGNRYLPPDQAYALPSPTESAILPIHSGMGQTWAMQPPQPQYYSSLAEPQPALARIPNECFLPYVQLFFKHLFSIMPIVDRNVYLNPRVYDPSNRFTAEAYAFLCSLCAATIVQLDAATQLPNFTPLAGRPVSDSDMFIEECLRARQEFDYIENPSPLTVMTSFFIFAHYGNNEKAEKAWHFLQEAITFAENLEMDDEDAILKLDPVDAQWRRRLYWLLFITERAYSIQRRKNCRLHPSIHIPTAFEDEDPRTLHGFVHLAHLFSAIDDNFVSIWRGARNQRTLCSTTWLLSTQKSLDTVAIALENITETQQLDIEVSREWLHVLAWQMGVSNGLVLRKGTGGVRLDYPVELARRTVRSTEGANPLALDSHGIGMEQKISDIGGCLADVLRVSRGDMSDTFVAGRQYLHCLLGKLSRIRGKESSYLRPLVEKSGGILDIGVPRALPFGKEGSLEEGWRG